MPEKRTKEGKLAKAIAEAVVGDNTEKDWDESFDDETKAKVSGYNDNGEEFNETDDDDDWKLDFETTPAATTLSQRSTLRTQNAPELGSFAFDDRYKGKKVSRKSAEISRLDDSNDVSTLDEKEQAAAELGYLLEGGSDEESDEETGSTEDEASNNGVAENGKDSYNLGNEVDYGSFGGVSEDEGTESGGTEEEHSEDGGNVSEDEISSDKNDETSITITEQNKSNEYQKGLAIKSQMVVWDRLLEYRIQLQKILQSINKFPQHSSWPLFVENIKDGKDSTHNGDVDKHGDTIKNCQSSIAKLLDLLLSTKSKLVENNPETKRKISNDGDEDNSHDHASRKKRKIADYESLLDSQHQRYLDFRNDTIERWNDRTRIAMGNSKSAKGKQASSFGSLELSTLKQIQHILSDTPRLVRRTQYKRTSYKVLGKVVDIHESEDDSNNSEDESNLQNKEREEYDSEIFDDDDFYHNLLRELIERKSGSDEKQQDNWLQIQKLRAKSNRKKVDTRASKGRKIRYDIHAKLVNFMAPVVNNTPGQISEEMDVCEDKQNTNSECNALASLGDYASSSENEDECNSDQQKQVTIKRIENDLHAEKNSFQSNDTKRDDMFAIDDKQNLLSHNTGNSDSFQIRQDDQKKELIENSGIFSSDSSDSSSSSSEDDESSSDSESEKDEKDSALESEEEQDSPKQKDLKNKQRATMKVKGEFLNSDLPPIEDLHISVPEFECVPLGKISSIVEDLVVVKAHPNTAALDIDSVLFLEKGKRTLGKVFDVIGPVASPFYCIRFNSTQHIKDNNVTVESEVYCAPRTEHTSFVFVEQLRKMKGSDASWKDDIEPQKEQQDFSDDEEERAARRTRNKLFKKQDEGLDCTTVHSNIPQDINGHLDDSKQGQRKILKAKRAYKPPSSSQQSNNAFYRNTKRNPRHTGPVRWNSIPSRNNFGNAEPVSFQSNFMQSNRSGRPTTSDFIPYNQYHPQHINPSHRPQMFPTEFSKPPPPRHSSNYNQEPMYHGGTQMARASHISNQDTSNHLNNQFSHPIYNYPPLAGQYENFHSPSNNHPAYQQAPAPNTSTLNASLTSHQYPPTDPPSNSLRQYNVGQNQHMQQIRPDADISSQSNGRIFDHISNEENLLPPGT